jgi:hypothetical protein
MPETYNLLINAGVAGVFAVFAVIIIREFIKHMDKQNTAWRKFLREEVAQRDKLMIGTMEEMKQLRMTLEELTAHVMALNGRSED